MTNEYNLFQAFGSWDDVDMRDSDTGELGEIASFFSHASPVEDDDASSIASNDAEPVVAQSFPKKSFPNFDDLRASSSCAMVAIADILGNKCRRFSSATKGVLIL